MGVQGAYDKFFYIAVIVIDRQKSLLYYLNENGCAKILTRTTKFYRKLQRKRLSTRKRTSDAAVLILIEVTFYYVLQFIHNKLSG